MANKIVSRGFHGRRQPAEAAGRVPPGQYVERDFPVLSAGPTPRTPLERWDFSVDGAVAAPRRWTWSEFRALPRELITRDIHCVTKWTKLDTHWQGVAVDTLLAGVAPLMAMLRHRAAARNAVPARLLYSARSYEEVVYRDELARIGSDGSGLETIYTLTRSQPADWTGYRRRIDTEMLREVAWPRDRRPQTFICGGTEFVEAAAASLVALGHEPARIKTERFGPTGGM